MKKRVIIIVFLLGTLSVFAQKFHGKATYKTHRKVDLRIKTGKGGANKKLQEQLKEQMKKMFQKTYTLYFTKATSIYTQNAKLATPQPGNNDIFVIEGNGGVGDILYKNTATKQYIHQKEVFSKRFLIKDTLEDYHWQLTDETKNIGIYTCYKATREKEEDYFKQIFKDGKMTEEKAKRIIKTEAWYTPQIPVSNGPDKYWGLPGLILEIKEGKQTIVCTEIVLNPKEKITIKAPKKGKKVSQKKFDKIMEKKSEEMMKRFQNNRGKKGKGESISIQFEG